FRGRIKTALVETKCVDHLHVRRFGESKKTVHVRLARRRKSRAVRRVTTNAKAFDSECFEGCNERLVPRAKEMIPVRAWQHILHFKAQADEIRSNRPTRCGRREFDVDR